MGSSPGHLGRRVPRLALRLALLIALLAVAVMPAFTTPRPAAAEALGDGWYHTLATVFGTPKDGTIGGMTSSGYYLQAHDHLVALPACTQSSCPWLSATNPTAAATERWGPQTLCAEADGFCWVELVSDQTGKCTVAPVRDVGPLFTNDNWWAPQAQRHYSQLPQGQPAAEAALQGQDLGYGPGKSNVGYDIPNKFHYAAGIDMAAGTWEDLGLAGGTGLHQVKVRLLWQTSITHDQACGNDGSGTTPPPTNSGSNPGNTNTTPNATVTEDLNLRGGPSTGDSVLAIMPGGARVTITGSAQNGFYPVIYNGTSGWAYGDWLKPDSATPPDNSGANPGGPATDTPNATVTEDLNLRGGPSTGDKVLAVMPAGARITVTGAGSNGFYPVTYNGTKGWAYGDWIKADGTTPSTPPDASMATVTEALNLRSGPSTSSGVLAVMPAGALVTLTGQGQNGFVAVSYNGTNGWAYATYLSGGAPPSTGGKTVQTTDSLNLRKGPSTTSAVLTVMPAGASVTLTGGSQNGFLEVTYNGMTGWASADYLTDFPTATVDSALNLRSSPSLDAPVLAVMPGGAKVQLLGANQGGFSKVSYNGQTGWAYSAYLR